RVAEPLLIVGADIEQDRQGVIGMNTGASRIERKLADRYAHAARTLIAQAQYALTVADDDDADLIEPRIGQDLADAMFVGETQEEAARLAPDLAEALAALADGWRVDERQDLFEIAHGQGIE